MDKQKFREAFARAGLPDYMYGGLERWVFHGIPPGDFLQAVLSNDLREACLKADSTNFTLIPEYVRFLWCHAPRGSWGSPSAVQHWAEYYERQRAEVEVEDLKET